MKKLGRLLAVCALLGLLLTGCNMPLAENRQVEDLLRAPQLAGDYGALQSALNDWLGESAQLKYPLQGELLSPFVLQDLDGDGVQDAAVFYTTAQSTNVCIAILQKDAEGNWEVRQNLEGLADTVDTVRLARLQAGGSTQLVVGYVASRGDNYLAVYSYEDGELSAILEQSYEQYLVEDITGGGNQDLILMSTLEDGGVQIELLTVDRDGSFQQVAVMGLSADKFSGCASVAAGVGADGKRYLVLDGWTGISGNNLATVLLHFDEESQQMIPADQISTQELYNESLRNVSTLVSRDLDGDGTVEIPTQPDEAEPPDGFYRLDGLHQPGPQKEFWPAGRGDQLLYRAAHGMGGQPDADRQHRGRGSRRAAHRGREQAGVDGAAGFQQRRCGGLDTAGHGGVPPDAGQIWPRCDHCGRDLSVVPLAVSLELALPAKVGSVLPALPEGEPLAKGAALRGTKKAESNGNLSTKRRI